MPNQHPEDIKARVRKRGQTMAGLARKARGVTDSAVRKSLREPIPRGNRIIAEYLGVPLYELWPEWYDRAGNRLSSSKASRDPARSHCQNGEAA